MLYVSGVVLVTFTVIVAAVTMLLAGIVLTTEATKMIAPWRRSAIFTPTLRATRNVPRRSIAMMRSNWAVA